MIDFLSLFCLNLSVFDKNFEASAEYQISQEDGSPIGVEAFAGFEINSCNNSFEVFQPILCIWLIGRRFFRNVAVYIKFTYRAFSFLCDLVVALFMNFMQTNVDIQISDFWFK